MLFRSGSLGHILIQSTKLLRILSNLYGEKYLATHPKRLMVLPLFSNKMKQNIF